MGYIGVHRRSLLGRIGGGIAAVFEALIIFWLTFEGFIHAREAPNLLVFYAALAGCLVAAVALHECGHLIVGLAAGEPVRTLRIGSGPTLFGFRIGTLAIQVGFNLLGGGAVYFSSVGGGAGVKRLASLMAGPFVNLLAGSYAVFLYDYTGASWLGVFALANAVCFVSSAMPSITQVGGRAHPTDGMQILTMLMKPEAALETPNFEAAVMTDGARKVLVRAGEDAFLSGVAEVSDESLLRALSLDEVVGELFASIGFIGKIPAASTADSDRLLEPHFSPAAEAAIEAGFKLGRDLGVDRPNSACICLGLLATDCPASHLMRAAGITEEAMRKLASVVTHDEEEGRTARVMSADLPLERWGTAADQALAQAFRVAVADSSPLIGTQHLVAALVADPQCRAAQALARTGFVLEWKPGVSEHVEKPSVVTPLLSRETELALAGAIWRTGATFPTGTAELCLGIVDQNAGEGAQLLVYAGATVHAIESALRFTPREPSYPAGCTPASRGMWLRRAAARMEAGRWLDARADFAEAERAAVDDNQRAVCRNNIAWASLMSGDPTLRAESLELARFAVSVKPDQPSFIGTYAFALLENGSPAEAASMLESSLPKVTIPRSRAYNLCELAMCYARLSQRDAAEKNLAAAAEADPNCPLLALARAQLGAVAA